MEHVGLQADREELSIPLSCMHPSVVCLQKTFLKESKVSKFKGFPCIRILHHKLMVANGGTAINSLIPHRKLDLQTNLQAVAVYVTYQKTITYLPFTSLHLWLTAVVILMIF